MKVIFCDVDGVLNSSEYMTYCYYNKIDPDDRMDPKAVKLLNELTDKTGAKIVVSSTWRLPFVHSNNLRDLVTIFKNNGVTGDIIGMTPDLWAKKHNRVRGDEIKDWMDNCGFEIESFVILDDDSDMGELWQSLIKTTTKSGLQRVHILEAIQVLGEKDV